MDTLNRSEKPSRQRRLLCQWLKEARERAGLAAMAPRDLEALENGEIGRLALEADRLAESRKRAGARWVPDSEHGIPAPVLARPAEKVTATRVRAATEYWWQRD